MKRTLRFSAVLLSVSLAVGCGTGNEEQKATQFIPEDSPVVLVTNPHHIISQAQISEHKDLMRALEIPDGFFDNLPEYGIDENENIFLFMAARSTFGATMKLADTGKFVAAISKQEGFDESFDEKELCLYDDEAGFKIIDDVIVLVVDENEDEDGIRRILRDMEDMKGPNKTNGDKFFLEMLDTPSVLGIWMRPQEALAALKYTGFSGLTSQMGLLSSSLAEDGSLYYSIKSEDGKLSMVSAGNYLDEDFLDEFEKYSGNHLDFIPETADLVLGCSLHGDTIVELLESSELKGQVDMAKMLGIDIWTLIDNIDGDMTLSINSFKVDSNAVVPELDATLMVDMSDNDFTSSFASDLNYKLSPLSKKVEENTYEMFLESLGQLNYGLEDDALYVNLSGKSFGKAKKSYKFNRLKGNVLAIMSIKSENIDKETFRQLENKAGMDLDFFDSMDMVSWLDGDIVRQEFEINLHDEENPLALIMRLVKDKL